VYQSIDPDTLEQEKGAAWWLSEMNSKAPEPDLCIYLDTPVETCLDRLSSRGGQRDVFEREGFLLAARRRYEELMAEDEGGTFSHAIRIDGSGSPREVHARIVELVSYLIVGHCDPSVRSSIQPLPIAPAKRDQE
jgi:thymidylate kinase